MGAGSKTNSDRLHPLVKAASQGKLPEWTVAGPGRRKHMKRVAKLLGGWAKERGEPGRERDRWMAAGYLHDTFRDADGDLLRAQVDPAFLELPEKVLHGPVAARRLRQEGVEDEELLHAISFHTVGSADFGPLGMALFAADFLEPGRKLRNEWREELRGRAANELDAVVKEILEARVVHLVGRGRPLRHETVAFWNRMSGGGAGWASASEL